MPALCLNHDFLLRIHCLLLENNTVCLGVPVTWHPCRVQKPQLNTSMEFSFPDPDPHHVLETHIQLCRVVFCGQRSSSDIEYDGSGGSWARLYQALPPPPPHHTRCQDNLLPYYLKLFGAFSTLLKLQPHYLNRYTFSTPNRNWKPSSGKLSLTSILKLLDLIPPFLLPSSFKERAVLRGGLL